MCAQTGRACSRGTTRSVLCATGRSPIITTSPLTSRRTRAVGRAGDRGAAIRRLPTRCAFETSRALEWVHGGEVGGSGEEERRSWGRTAGGEADRGGTASRSSDEAGGAGGGGCGGGVGRRAMLGALSRVGATPIVAGRRLSDKLEGPSRRREQSRPSGPEAGRTTAERRVGESPCPGAGWTTRSSAPLPAGGCERRVVLSSERTRRRCRP